MKRIIILLLTFITTGLFAQEALPLGVSSMVDMYQDVLNNKFGKGNIEIDDNLHIKNHVGSPLLLSKWSKAEVLFDDGKLYTIPYVNYDALDDSFLVYLKNLRSDYKGIASVDFPLVKLTGDNIITIALTNNEDGVKRFVRISPNRFAGSPKTQFFEYFSVKPKDALVLKSTYKKIKKNHMKGMPYTDSSEDFEFKTFSTYYIKNKDKLFVPTHLGKKAVLKAINDPAAVKPLKKYIKTHHLKMSHPEDVQKLLEYYFKGLKS